MTAPLHHPLEGEALGDSSAAVKFLLQRPGFPVLTAIHVDAAGKKGLVETRSFPQPVDTETLHEWIDARQGRANIYYSVNPLLQPMDKKAARTDVKSVVSLHVDLDPWAGEDQDDAVKRIAQQVAGYAPQPTWVIASGGGVQCIWDLVDPIPIDGDEAKAEDTKYYNIQLERDLGGDNCHDISRILRVPYTKNLPDERKLKKGRRPAVATILAGTGAPVEVALFKKATPKEATPTAVAVAQGTDTAVTSNKPRQAKIDRNAVKVGWLKDVNDLNARVENHAKLTLLYAGNPQQLAKAQEGIGHRTENGKYQPYNDDSRMLEALVGALDRAGYSPEDIAGVAMDPEWRHAFAHVHKQRDKWRAIERALGAAQRDHLIKQREAETGVSFPDGYDQLLRPCATYRNTRAAIINMGWHCRYDVFHDRRTIEGTEISPLVGEVTDMALILARQMIADRFNYDPGKDNVYDAIMSLCTENRWDPVLDYLDGLKWDTTPRLDAWVIRYLGCPDTPLNRAIGRLTLIAAVRRVRNPGTSFHQIIVLEGPEGTNKSSAIRIVAGAENFSDQSILGVDERKVQELLLGIWLYEIAELTDIGKADVNKVKSFASRDTDRARRAYGRCVEKQPRRCVLFATTNDDVYLRSQTGNRRFWPLATSTIDLKALEKDRDQLWAEAAHLEEQQGTSIVLDKSLWEAARVEQEARREQDPWEDLLCDIPDGVNVCDGRGNPSQVTIIETSNGEQRVSAAALLEHVLKVPPAHQTNAQGQRLATCMRHAGWQRHKQRKVYIGGKRVNGYWRAQPRTGVGAQ